MDRAHHGLLVLDKPQGMTSRRAVDHVQKWFPRGTKIGHAGTLDPLATGVLVVGIGNGTRLIEYVQHMDKAYRTTILLGVRSDTDDGDGKVEKQEVTSPPDRILVETCLAQFLGIIQQIPPAFSAMKIAGQRAYALARRGSDVALAARPVRIDSLEILDYAYPRLELEVQCGKGTYIRSLARDLGDAVGCGGMVQTLRRLRIGPFEQSLAVSLDIAAEQARERLLPLSKAVQHLPRVVLAEDQALRWSLGEAVAVPETGPECQVWDEGGKLLGVGAYDNQQRLLRPSKVLRPPASW